LSNVDRRVLFWMASRGNWKLTPSACPIQPGPWAVSTFCETTVATFGKPKINFGS